MHKTLIAAHRGANAFAKENTIEAFKKSIDIGADMIETDVRKTKDNVLVCHHDPNYGSKLICNMTYNEINSLSDTIGYKMPTLEELLKLSKNKIILDIELKETGYENKVVNMILRYISPEDFIITSFYDDSLDNVKKINPNIKTGLLLGDKVQKSLNLREMSSPFEMLAKLYHSALLFLTDVFPIKRLTRIKADFVVPHYRLLNTVFVKRAWKYNYPIIVYTVNNENTIKKIIHSENVYCIITDYSDLALNIRRKYKKK